MQRTRLGIWLGRRIAVSVCLSADGRSVASHQNFQRLASESSEKILERLLLELPEKFHNCELRIALSPCFVACCDSFELPFHSESEIETTGASSVESRCAGENAEDLAVDIRRISRTSGGSLVHAIAVRQKTLEAIRSTVARVLPNAELCLVTGASPILAQAVKGDKDGMKSFALAVKESGEVHLVSRTSYRIAKWRAFSFDYVAADSVQKLKAEAELFGAADIVIHSNEHVPLIENLSVEAMLAVATAAALVDPKEVINLLRGAQDAPKSSIERLRRPLIAACVAVVAFCVTIGIYFNARAAVVQQAIVETEAIERSLAKEYLHGEKLENDSLTLQMNKRLAEYNKRLSANRHPSVLAFWSEVAQSLPSPERIGLITDSIQLGREEGRLIGRVTRAQDDALKNASLLETQLNRSGELSAHGEFETKETEILVRLRMNYHPRTNPQIEVFQTSEAKP